jgi:hypothetical protein
MSQIPEEWISQEGLGWAGSGMAPWAISRRIGRNDSMTITHVASEVKPKKEKNLEASGIEGYSFDEIVALSMLVLRQHCNWSDF